MQVWPAQAHYQNRLAGVTDRGEVLIERSRDPLRAGAPLARGDGEGPNGGASGRGRGRVTGQPVSLGTLPGSPVAPAAAGAPAAMDQHPRPGGRGAPGRQSDVGQAQAGLALRREGVGVSASTIGRILKSLVARGVVTPVPTLRKRPGGRRFRLSLAQRYARRLSRGLKADRPGALVQIDTLFVNLAPGQAIKHFTAYRPVAKWTVGAVFTRASAQCATALLDKLIAEAPFPVTGIQSLPSGLTRGFDGGSEFKAGFEDA